VEVEGERERVVLLGGPIFRELLAAGFQVAADAIFQSARVVVTIDPNPDAPIMGRIKK